MRLGRIAKADERSKKPFQAVFYQFEPVILAFHPVFNGMIADLTEILRFETHQAGSLAKIERV